MHASDSKQRPIDSGGFVLYKLVLELCPKIVPGLSYKTRGKVWPIVGRSATAYTHVDICQKLKPFVSLILVKGVYYKIVCIFIE